ncbi:MAG: hypothetical protein U1F16_03170 [Turneriella sp.]
MAILPLGYLHAARINFTAGNPAVADDVNANFIELYNAKWTLTGADLSYSAGNIGIGVATPGVKLGVVGGSAITNSTTGFAILGATSGTHLSLDSTQIQGWSNTTAANMTLNGFGGYVGIGAAPLTTLFVSGQLNFGIAIQNPNDTTANRGASYHFYHQSTENARIYANRQTGNADGADLYVQTRPVGGALTTRMTLLSTGELGVGTTAPGAKLHIGGAVDSNGTSLATIKASGGLIIENAAGTSALNIDDNELNSSATFFINTNAKPVNVGGSLTAGNSAAAGLYQFYAKGNINGTSTAPQDHIAIIENASNGVSPGPDGLAIWFSGISTVDSGNNFITFLAGGSLSAATSKGAIEGNGGGGNAVFTSGNADYAEMLRLGNGLPTPEAGDIVAIDHGNAVSSLQGNLFMPVSNSSIVIGNTPANRGDRSKFATAGFVGQVKIKVRGSVHSGDFVIASEKEAGIGVAVAAKDILPGQFTRVVGRAWETSNNTSIKLINCLVGVPQAYPIQEIVTRVEAHNHHRLAALETKSQTLEQRAADAEKRLSAARDQLHHDKAAADTRIAALENKLAEQGRRLNDELIARKQQEIRLAKLEQMLQQTRMARR